VRHLLTKRSTPAHVEAEWRYPVRVRVPVPAHGLGHKLNEMHEWLRERAPDGQHFVGSDRGPPDAALVYFADIKVAHEFYDEFSCGRVERAATS
jgi:hypothetical protein